MTHDVKIALEFKRSCLKRPKPNFISINEVKIFIVNELHSWSQELDANFPLKDCLLQAFKLTKNADPDKCFYHI